MNDNEIKKKPDTKILIVENNENIGKKMSQILIQAGYKTSRINTCFGALAAIEDVKGKPFAVIIATYEMQRMNGVELLKNAKTIAPETQRVLIIERPDIKSIMNAVNRAGIHSCISLPFRDELFLSEISQRSSYFNQIMKKNRLLKITRHQNKQLYQMALKLKEKNEDFAGQIKKKKRILQALKPPPKKDPEKKKEYSLAQLLELKGIEMFPDIISKEFKNLAFKMKCFIEDCAVGSPVELKKIDELLSCLIQNSSRRSTDSEPDNISFQEPWLDTSLINQILNLFFEYEFFNAKHYAESNNQGMTDICDNEKNFIITVSEDNLSASLQILTKGKASSSFVSVQNIKKLLKKKGIVYGIWEDTVIEEWLTTAPDTNSSLIIAKGIAPFQPVHAEIKYLFDVNFLQAGKIKSDGTIDFRERGVVPFVHAGTLLAEKKNCRQGTAGTDIYGNIISVPPPEDIIFEIGNNTRFSDDKLKIYATEEGQPHLDAMGAISVYPELRIDGDVAYETGNVNFNGNLVVAGTVKEGFSVRCANLTANQIQGAEINITGNLNVSSGIIDSNVINVQGHIQTKYVNNSQLKAFGNIIVQREIIDSQIFTGGECINEKGSILSSSIYAKGGIRAGNVGTEKATPSKFEIGTDKLMDIIIAELDERIKKNNADINLLKEEIQELDNTEKLLLEKITNFAYEQDKAQTELRQLKRKLPDFKKSKDKKALKNILETIHELQQTAIEAEEIIDEAFEQQDSILVQINDRKQEIEKIEDSNKQIVHKKRAMREYSNRTQPKAELTVQKAITGGTLIKGTQNSLLLKDNQGRCRIHEIKISDETSVPVFEIRISNI